ncbi:MAG: hypothetical protein DYG93_04020 [Leptolyngbya sp. PLA2]|nr:hypothetical protein [Leptolyngbya sp.]MCE7970821.1 hypothetical protein [Leptolyngbya sp. PL-A2]MCQ3939976.1 hypothetical protein [cyanobacterium CYA1]MCZ7633603.1 nitrate reductase cytochrome c-type subunit [Phycisphaerales bacterium]MDL1903279.1 hypothetical protein [Synechococcales cyanobacterium CNB]GIK17973.1 MAG: hypothetical protein BroJett004_01370 [Planctomycetota bacterium]
MSRGHPRRRYRGEIAWTGFVAGLGAAVALASATTGARSVLPLQTTGDDRAAPMASTPWLLSQPAANVVPADRANPGNTDDKFTARVRSMEERATLRAYEGAPPVIPHPVGELKYQACRACHAQGLRAGEQIARMASHTHLTNCTQCHVEAAGMFLGDGGGPRNSFEGLRPSGYGSTRAWAGAPPVIPHTTFMRTNCVSCHGEHGYDGWKPDHLDRTNCVQCHAPAASLDQLSPTFGEELLRVFTPPRP